MTMTQRQRYLSLARAALDGSAEISPADRPPGVETVIQPAATSAGGGSTTTVSAPGLSDERNERNERMSAADDAGRRLVMGRWRATLSPSLRHWEDDTLLALASWHLALAFGRAGANGFRRHLPPSLRQLSDDDLDMLADWPSLATLEEVSWRGNASSTEQLAAGAQRLAAWWNVRRDAERKRRSPVPSRPTTNAQPEERLPGV